MKLTRWLLALLLPIGIVGLLGVSQGEDPKPVDPNGKIVATGDAVVLQKEDDKKDEQEHGKGLIVPKDVEERHAKSWEIHKHILKALPQVTASSFDCRKAGWMPDFDDQGPCGDCWVFSGADCIASAAIKAGYGPKLTISKQQLLDCHFRGACGGGWPEDVAKVAKQYGVVTDADYGVPYKAGPGPCKAVDPSKVIMVDDYGFASQSSGISSYQDMKNAMMNYGVLSTCYASSGTPSYGENGPVWKGNGSRNVDHAIKIIAFDDSKDPDGAVLCWNQWNANGKDLFWAKWGANQIGTSTMWTKIKSITPPTPPVPPIPPVPPGPTPPNPLSPSAYTIDVDNKTISAGKAWTINGGKLGDSFIDLSQLSPAQAAAVREIYNDLLKQQPAAPKQMPKTMQLPNWMNRREWFVRY